MKTAPRAGTLQVILKLILCVECLLPLDYTFANCKVRGAEAEGHQPWRSDARSVANVELIEVEPALTISDVDQLSVKQIFKSEKRSVFAYENTAAKKSYRVTERKFNWQGPDTNKEYLTVWWLTEIIIRDCSRKPNDK